MEKKIRGKIIRIVDTNTVVINLGRIHGVNASSIFSILGKPETIIDPFTKETLGVVSVVKGTIKATSVSDKFTIASSKWSGVDVLAGLWNTSGNRNINSELRVKEEDIKPWKAVSEDFVILGDEVEVAVQAAQSTKESKQTPTPKTKKRKKL